MKFELEPYHRNVTKEEFIADLRRVALELKKNSVTTEEYNKYGKFHCSTLQRKFGSWFTALKCAGLEKTRNLNLSKVELLEDLKQVAKILKKGAITTVEYESHGKFSVNPFIRIFGSWFKALEKAGLERTRNLGITDEQYFENLEEVWRKLGRQPHYNDIRKPLSKYSAGAYEYRYGTWRKALEKFIKYVNDERASEPIEEKTVTEKVASEPKENFTTHKTKRNISWRLRFIVMKRDDFKCRACGRSPATDSRTILHVDHVKPYSKGGETLFENLQTLCQECNIGKSNLH